MWIIIMCMITCMTLLTNNPPRVHQVLLYPYDLYKVSCIDGISIQISKDLITLFPTHFVKKKFWPEVTQYWNISFEMGKGYDYSHTKKQ